MHRGLSTLEVLVVGLAVIAVFEATLGTLRVPTSFPTKTASTSSWARGFIAIWVALPATYFKTRRVGDSLPAFRSWKTYATS